MSDMVLDANLTSDADYEAAFNGFLAEIKQHEATLDKYHAEIAEIWKEARTIGAKTDAILSETERQLNAMRRRG